MENLARLTIAFIAVLLLAACGSARRSDPISGTPQLSVAAQAGQQTFMAHCYACHPNGEAGLGPAINNKPLPRSLMRFQIRHGIGAMPAFDEQLIADDDLERLLDYLGTLRHAG